MLLPSVKKDRDGILVPVCMVACLLVCLFQSLVLEAGLRVCSESLKMVVPRGVTGPFWEAWVVDWNLLGERELNIWDSCDLLPRDGVRKSCRNSHFHGSGFFPKR